MTIWNHLKTFSRRTEGSAAIEIGLTGPILIFGCVLMLDVGLALGERMDLDRNVRAGVQAAMAQQTDLQAIEDVIMASADGASGVAASVTKTCFCGNTAVVCTNWCSATVPPSVFLNISASRPHDSILLPPFNLDSQTHVQLR